VRKKETIWRCDLVPQYRAYKKEIDIAVKRVLASGRYTLAEEVSAFEAEFAAYSGCKYAVGVGNATDGLTLALKALGIEKGDEVITSPFTAIPTVSAIIAAGAVPVFIDIQEKTFLLDIEKISERITSRTKAVIPVHIFGNVVDVERLGTVLPQHVQIIEDAAQAHGSLIRKKHAGSLGNVGVFSFYPTKNLGGVGDGGAVVTNDPEIYKTLKLLRTYGMVNKDSIVINGVNTRLDELQAAVLRIKLEHLDNMNARRNIIAEEYRNGIKRGFLMYQEITPDVYSNYHVFAARVNGDRSGFIDYLSSVGIQTNVYYPIPLHLQYANRYLGYKSGDFPVCEKLCREVIALPMYAELDRNKRRKVIKAINTYANSVKD
jgi:dTDP-4-amino-4,6-dideoxygalactose transaminase